MTPAEKLAKQQEAFRLKLERQNEAAQRRATAAIMKQMAARQANQAMRVQQALTNVSALPETKPFFDAETFAIIGVMAFILFTSKG